MSVFGGAGITSAGVAARLHPGMPAGRFQWMLTGPQAAAGSPSAAAGRLAIYPWAPPYDITVSSLFIETTVGGAGSSVKIGIWDNDPSTGFPTGLPLVSINAGIDTTVAEQDVVAVTPFLLRAGRWVWVLNNFTGTAPSVVRGGSIVGYWASSTVAQAGANSLFSAEAYATDISTLNLTGRSWSNSGNQAMLVGVGF